MNRKKKSFTEYMSSSSGGGGRMREGEYLHFGNSKKAMWCIRLVGFLSIVPCTLGSSTEEKNAEKGYVFRDRLRTLILKTPKTEKIVFKTR